MRNKKTTFDSEGREVLDDTPVAIPVGFKRPPTLQEQIARAVRSEHFKNLMEAADMETFEEADDFDVGEDFDPMTPYEMEFDPDLGKEITHAEKVHLDRQRDQFDAHMKQKMAEAKSKPKPKKQPKKEAKKNEESDDSDE